MYRVLLLCVSFDDTKNSNLSVIVFSRKTNTENDTSFHSRDKFESVRRYTEPTKKHVHGRKRESFLTTGRNHHIAQQHDVTRHPSLSCAPPPYPTSHLKLGVTPAKTSHAVIQSSAPASTGEKKNTILPLKTHDDLPPGNHEREASLSGFNQTYMPFHYSCIHPSEASCWEKKEKENMHIVRRCHIII